jgi:predicted nucleic acid-binding protein
MGRILIDTNILVYFVSNAEPEKHAIAKRLLDDANTHPGKYVIGMQNIREFAEVITRKKYIPFERACEALVEFRYFFGEALLESNADFREGLQLAHNEKIPFFDALLATTAFRHGVTTIYTENTKDFEKIPGIKAINPLK